MIVAPETEIYLIKSPLQVDEAQQLDFANATAQVNYFQSLPKLALMNATYQRENERMYVNFNIEEIRSYNYVMYKNKQYSNKWFYAFITGFSYEGNTVTGVQIKTDVFQTYMFDYELKRSYVKRETVPDDTFGKHLIPENVDTGDYVINRSKTEFVEVASTRLTEVTNSYTPLIVVQCSEKVGVLYESPQAGASVIDDTYIIGSMPQGCYYYMFYNLPLGEEGGGYESFTKFRNHLDSIGKGGAIVNMFMIPQKSVYSVTARSLKMYAEDGTESNVRVPVLEASANTYGATLIDSKTYAMPTKIGNYTPKNNKLFTAQFNYFLVSNFAGTAFNFNWEDFKSPVGAIQTPNFRINGVISATTSFSIQPMNSIKSDVDNLGNKVSSEFIAGQQLPTLSWDSDYYLNWLAQNGKKFDLQKQNMIGDIVGNTLSSAITTGLGTGSVAMAGVAGAGSLIGGMVEYDNLVDNINEQKREADIVPNTVSGNLNAGDMAFALNSVGFGFFNYQIREDMAIKIDRYFDMFGYRVNEIKTPNTKTRRYWNYLQTVGVNLEGNIPQEALAELKAMYNTGITIWHDPSNFLNYELTNSII